MPPTNISTPRPEIIQNSDTQSHDQIPKELTEQDYYTQEYWVKYDPRIHTREGHNTLKIKSKDPVTGFIVERTNSVIYKTDKQLLFQTTKQKKPYDIWIDNTAAFSSYSVSMDLHPSISELLNTTN